jgi:hypothetical protein
MFAGQGSLRRIEKGDQKRVFPFRQRDRGPFGVGQTSRVSIYLPAAKAKSTPRSIALGRDAPNLPSTQDSPNPREQLTKAERLDQIIVSPQLEPDHAVDFAASMTGHNNHWDIRARSDFAKKVESIILTQSQIEDHEVGLGNGEVPRHLFALAGAYDMYVVLFEVALDHVPDGRIVVDEENSRRPDPFVRPFAGPSREFPLTLRLDGIDQ